MSAELAARRTAAAALLAEFERDDEAADNAARAVWAGRLAAMLASVLGALDAADRNTPLTDESRLAEIRGLLAAFDWEHDSRQYALEEIERIAGGSQ
jgi:hypothetical protein